MLMGGSDVCPESYGEKALKPEWNGDRIRDDYEIALLRAFMALRKPVLGVCRGAQVINVAQGGTLYQDLGTQAPHALNHRNWAIYEQNCHATSFVPGSGLARLYPGHDARQDQLDPPPGGEGPRPRPRRRGVVGARPHRRGDPLHGPGVRVRASSGIPSSTRRTIPRSSTTRRSSTISSPPPRSTRPPPTRSDDAASPNEDHQSRHRRRHRRRRRRQRRRGAPQVRGRARAARSAGRRCRSASGSTRSRSSASGSSRCRRRSRAR